MNTQIQLQTKDGKAFCTSLQIAQYFGKQHKNVLRDIESKTNELPESFTGLNFELSEYQDSTGRSLPMYLLSRDGFAFIAMGFTGKKANEFKIEFIHAFNTIEERLKQGTEKTGAIETARKWKAMADFFEIPDHLANVEIVKAVKRLTGEDYSEMLSLMPSQDRIPRAEMWLEPRELGKLFYMSGTVLNRILCEKGLQVRKGDNWVPTEKGADHCYPHAWNNGTKTGYNLKWRLEFIEQVIQ